jgi:NDP-sugar pyrophosphorylase family protein
VPPDEAQGEFIGLARLSAAGAARFVARYHQRRQALAGRPYGTAPRFEVSYVTDLFNDLIDGGEALSAAYIDGQWREIDTVEDLARAKEVVTW